MTGAIVDMFEWKAFTLKIFICKSLTGLTGDAASYVIDWERKFLKFSLVHTERVLIL